ncbi:MAG: PD-(D/E)XK nuclease family protein [Elusimicrobia bacterium]|nr:PD-(D/E)XK nuclease family protein [Elusimicrobiota bacterium]MDE2236760.1 PD-(D/E)XK nuclease family protein [Elusimicrobiota bacterium]MDE2426440.1 PD-(D/E)XK nuclease family protein [Elusimicrobiota bacterium]
MPFSLPRPLSHSSISLFQDCPQKYKFKYVDKIPEKPRHFFSFGQSVHSALEFLYAVQAPPPPTLEALLACYQERWVSAGYRDGDQEAQYFEDGKRILAAYYRKHAKDFAVPLFVEYGFTLEVEGVPVTGKVDRVDALADGRLAILDYKTGKALAASRVERDAQLTMYQLACERLLGRTVARLSFYHLPSLKEQVVERHSTELVETLTKRIVSTAERISAGRFKPTPSEAVCRWCDYKPLCPVYGGAGAGAVEQPDQELSEGIDELGELLSRAEALKKRLLATMEEKGYARAFGRRFEVVRSAARRWEFSDKKKVLELLSKAGLYERVLAPSAPKVEALMSDVTVSDSVRARLAEYGAPVTTPDLKVKPL